MSDRVDLYKLIHKYARAVINQVTVLAGSTDFSNKAENETFKENFYDLLSFLDDHAEREETHIHPLLQEIESSNFEKVETEHAELEALLNDLKQNLENASTPAEFTKFYQSFIVFQAKYYLHLNSEETVLMPELQKNFTDQRLNQVNSAILSNMPRENMIKITRGMLPVINHWERVEVFKGMKLTMPPRAFDNVCNIAREVLTSLQATQLFQVVSPESINQLQFSSILNSGTPASSSASSSTPPDSTTTLSYSNI